jgi:hypothetical protein
MNVVFTIVGSIESVRCRRRKSANVFTVTKSVYSRSPSFIVVTVPYPEGRECTDPVSADAILGKGGGDSPDRIKGRQLAPDTGGDKT